MLRATQARMLRVLALAAAMFLAAVPVTGQVDDPAEAPPEVLIINLDRMFVESLFGTRVRTEYNRAAEDLQAENAEILAELRAQELDLTERRPEMTVEDFRAEAEAFDARVQEIRRVQDSKEQALQAFLDDQREAFRRAVEPVIARLMVERGANIVLYHNTVYLAVDTVDITDDGIAAINAALGAGPDDESVTQQE